MIVENKTAQISNILFLQGNRWSLTKIITIPITKIISVEQGGKTQETVILQTNHSSWLHSIQIN